ncbi:serine hydrolase [Phenylobacterium sp.]|uniref:serine hydrolase domain-containing protein n=1 Tax=Phenylobacterium sp. TaxID=1871053 RepID=UPI0025FF61D8|nr:serine hydrolase [Phenylobacterium sp.]
MGGLPPLPAQPRDVAWPTRDWPTGAPAVRDRARLDGLLARAFDAPAEGPLGKTYALLAVQGGRLTFERYGFGATAESTQPSWSMAKSMTQALVGMLALDGRLDVAAPADVPEWQAPGDPRAAITTDQLLRMSSGLAFVEDYVPGSVSDVLEMLYGSGKADTAAYAAGRPLAHPPGTFWSYASGTTNIVARLAAKAHGGDFAAYMRERLFQPLGMTSATPKFDAVGTFIGSSFCFCTPRDFARFGLLYLRDGVWEGRRLLPEGWVDYARTPTFQQAGVTDAYGAHWWLGLGGPGSFSANGYAGQFIVVCPERDLIVVRNGDTPLEAKDALRAWMAEAVDCFG